MCSACGEEGSSRSLVATRRICNLWRSCGLVCKVLLPSRSFIRRRFVATSMRETDCFLCASVAVRRRKRQLKVTVVYAVILFRTTQTKRRMDHDKDHGVAQESARNRPGLRQSKKMYLFCAFLCPRELGRSR